MRKFLLVLLTMGLIMAFAMPAAALDVQFSGSYYAQGVYDSNRSLKGAAGRTGDASQAFVANRLRMQTEFKVAEGLSLVTRFDALEKKWGDQTWPGNPQYDSANRLSSGTSSARAQENFEFERVYVDFNTAIGKFMVGYQQFGTFGTSLIDTPWSRGGIKYILPIGNHTIVLAMEQIKETTSDPYVGTASSDHSDGDKTAYDLSYIYKWQGGDAGILLQYIVGKDTRPGTAPAGDFTQTVYLIDPYVKAKFGPVFVEAEFLYGGGYFKNYDRPAGAIPDEKVDAYGAYVHAMGTFGPAYVGAKFLYLSGDDPKSSEREGGLAQLLQAGQVSSPCLMLFNDETSTWLGALRPVNFATPTTGYMSTATNNFPDNVWLVGVYGGVKPIPKLDVQAGVYYAKADEAPTMSGLPPSATNPKFKDREYGLEIDLIAKYKIYDNLEYMVGFGYLFTGDYYKGTSTQKVADDYMITHKLTLSF